MIRVATAPLSRRIYAGTVTKDGKAFRSDKRDVTDEVMIAVAEHLSHEDMDAEVWEDGKVKWRITVDEVAE